MTEPSSSAAAKLPSAEFAPGNVLASKYRIDQVIGVGGMGIILAGRHLELDQRVAIKALRKDALEDPDIVARFLREARASAKLKSEHVARVIDVGLHGESRVPYIIMEFLHGQDLSEVQKAKGPLPIPLAVEYVLQACEAIAEAHALGIVHRDLKPANLFLTKRPDGSALVKVLDFGISKMTDSMDIATGGDPLTKTAMMMGSPHYMPPEQLRSARDVDQRADIWSLGIVLHRLLTGQHAFDANTTPELCVSILVGSPQALRGALPNAPEGLEQVILRCLQKEAWARFPNVAELARALTPFATTHARVSIDRIVTMQRNGRSGSVPPPGSGGAADANGDVGETSVDVAVPLGEHGTHVSTMAASVASTEAARRNAGLPRSRMPALLVAVGAVLVLGAVGVVVAPRVLPSLKNDRAINGASSAASSSNPVAVADTRFPPIPPESTPVPTAVGAGAATPAQLPVTGAAAASASSPQAPLAQAAQAKGALPRAKVQQPAVMPPPQPATPAVAPAAPTPAAPSDPSGFGDRK